MFEIGAQKTLMGFWKYKEKLRKVRICWAIPFIESLYHITLKAQMSMERLIARTE